MYMYLGLTGQWLYYLGYLVSQPTLPDRPSVSCFLFFIIFVFVFVIFYGTKPRLMLGAPGQSGIFSIQWE